TKSDGTLNLAAYQWVGYQGAGSFSQSGGTTTSPGVFVGGAGQSGTYSVSGGTVTSTGWMTSVGHGGSGTLNVSATGTLSTSDLYIGNGDAGAASAGTANQSGGGVNVGGSLYVAHNGASGVYHLSGGTITVAAGGTPGPVINNG